jgi:hypothetical protein
MVLCDGADLESVPRALTIKNFTAVIIDLTPVNIIILGPVS